MTGFLPIPTYLLSDEELTAIADRLEPFATGDAETTDGEPCARAAETRAALAEELKRRGSTFTLKADGSISVDQPTNH